MKNREKRVGISQSWYSRSLGSEIHEDIFIRKCVRNIYLKHGILTSEPYINRYPERISIKFFMFCTDSSQYKIQWELYSLLKSLLVLKYNKNIDISFKQSPHLLFNSKILTDFLKVKMEQNPLQSKMTLKRLFVQIDTELKKWDGKKKVKKHFSKMSKMSKMSKKSKKF